MTTYVAVFLGAWAAGYVAGYQVRVIRAAIRAAG